MIICKLIDVPFVGLGAVLESKCSNVDGVLPMLELEDQWKAAGRSRRYFEIPPSLTKFYFVAEDESISILEA